LKQTTSLWGVWLSQKDEAIIYSKTIGFSDIENKTNANESSKYRIGSISKTFTSVLVLKAAEENKLNLNQTINKYFPTIKNAKEITINLSSTQLLQ
jgi:CubicO group peptidase (beta-lactamase class C family)